MTLPTLRYRPRVKTAAVVALVVPPLVIGFFQEAAAEESAQIYQAETGSSRGFTIATEMVDHWGDGYLESSELGGGSVTISIPGCSGGRYDISLRYAAPEMATVVGASLNGQALGELTLASAESFTETPVGLVTLMEGENSITIAGGSTRYQIDAIRVTRVPSDSGSPSAGTGEQTAPGSTPSGTPGTTALSDPPQQRWGSFHDGSDNALSSEDAVTEDEWSRMCRQTQGGQLVLAC